MRIDLFHNKIVKDTMTERFEESVREVLVPKVSEVYPDALGILMYEDYIADDLVADGKWYYPLTVRLAGESVRLWVMWPYDAESFASRSPYSYVGDELLAFELAGYVPEEFEAAVEGRSYDYDEGAIRVNVRASADDHLILAGRYSQTFVDELAAQMTHEISRIMSLEGLGTSTIELELVFAPGTYMEHTSENVTYRRLLLVDGASRPRDFWVKWTRTAGGAAYTVSDHISGDDILFELGEDVAHKIREKEYRFLCSSNPATYQAALGKKTVTEWRDLIKRAIRRGEIVKTESELVIAERAGEVHDKMAELLGGLGYSAPKTEEAYVAESDAGFASLIDMARAALERSEAHAEPREAEPETADAPDTDVIEPESTDEAFAFGGLDLTEGEEDVSDAEDTEEAELSDEDEPDVEENSADEESEPEELTIDELLRRVDEAEAEDAKAVEADEDEGADESDAIYTPIPAISDDVVVETPSVLTEEDDIDEDEPETEETDEEEIVEAAEEIRVDEDAIRREIEAKIRLEYETQARARAEAELEKLLAESRALREENERLAKAAREAAELHKQALSDQLDAAERARATEDSLRRELEEKERREARERDRLAEAARIAVEEQRRREAEEREAREREEAERLARLEAERAREAERLRIEAEEREAREREEREEQERLLRESEFISKRAKIIFRSATDPNVISRIREIIEETIRREGKQNVRIHMRAYQEDRDTINLDILKMPRAEQELLVAMVKAIGNARIGVVKIILE